MGCSFLGGGSLSCGGAHGDGDGDGNGDGDGDGDGADPRVAVS